MFRGVLYYNHNEHVLVDGEVINISVTIKQIAEMAGVHRATVDKVLHNRPGVSDKVRANIQRIINETGYKVNPLGKALSSQGKRTVIGAILLKVDALLELRQGIEMACREFSKFNLTVEYRVIEYPDVEGQFNAIRDFLERGVDGIIILPLHHPSISTMIELVADQGVPIVTINNDIPGKRLCYIGQDADKAGVVAGRMMQLFLQDGGQVAVAVDTARSLLSLAKREKSFLRYLNEHTSNLTPGAFINTREDPQTAYDETVKQLKRNPDTKGLLITCGTVPEICKAVADVGRDDITVICYERYPQIIKLLEEGRVACTITTELVQQGYQSLKVLYDYCMYGHRPEKTQYMDIGILLKENL